MSVVSSASVVVAVMVVLVVVIDGAVNLNSVGRGTFTISATDVLGLTSGDETMVTRIVLKVPSIGSEGMGLIVWTA